MQPRILTLVLASALAMAAQAQTADVYVSDAAGIVTSDAQTTAAASVGPLAQSSSLYGGQQRSTHQGTAAAAQQTLRAAATLAAWHPTDENSFSAETEVSFLKQVVVGPGSSGLAPGAPVTLTLQLQLDGTSGVGLLGRSGLPYTGTGRMLSSADIGLVYRIRDLDDVVCGEGCQPRTLLSFGYRAQLDYDSYYGQSISSSWKTGGTLVGGVPTANPVDFYSDSVSPGGRLDDRMDTGLIQFDIATFVGHRLEVRASLDVFLQAMGRGTTAEAAGSFGNTFDAGLSSPVAGLELAGELAGIYPAVPEPGTALLLLAGLATVAAGRRARR